MSLMIIGENDSKDVHASRSVSWPFSFSTDAPKVTFSFNITTGPDGEDAPDWNVCLKEDGNEIWSNYSTKAEVKVEAPEKLSNNIINFSAYSKVEKARKAQ